MENKKILLVEDDLNLGFLLLEFLESEGYTVKLARDGKDGLHYFQNTKFDLLILDVMMPEMDGFTLAKIIREQDAEVPLIFLTARSLKADKLAGFDLNADDYICKPFDEEELLCRIKAILRRSAAPTIAALSPTLFSIGNYKFDYNRQELSIDDNVIRVTEKENEVLRLLCLHKNKILRRDDAVEEIYGKKDYFLGRSFDVFISKIRKMLKDDPNVFIENVFRVGFILNVKEGAA